MDPEEFTDTVQDEGDFESLEEARAATKAVFETFGERIAAGEAEDVASFVPQEFHGWLVTHEPESAESFGVEAFFERVADRGDVSTETAREWSQAVFDGLAQYAPARELGRVQVQLPTEYELLVNWPTWTSVEAETEHHPRSELRQADHSGPPGETEQ